MFAVQNSDHVLSAQKSSSFTALHRGDSPAGLWGDGIPQTSGYQSIQQLPSLCMCLFTMAVGASCRHPVHRPDIPFATGCPAAQLCQDERIFGRRKRAFHPFLLRFFTRNGHPASVFSGVVHQHSHPRRAEPHQPHLHFQQQNRPARRRHRTGRSHPV